MIAMQYSFVLPADYDMGVVERRIRDKGPLFDGFPGLRMKAFVSARRQGGDFANAENLYAPFYLWDDAEGLSGLLTNPGFAGLARDFGWPVVRTWFLWRAEFAGPLAAARFASREIETIAAYADLATLRGRELESASAAVREGALAAVVAFNPADWTLVRFRLRASPSRRQRHLHQLFGPQVFNQRLGLGVAGCLVCEAHLVHPRARAFDDRGVALAEELVQIVEPRVGREGDEQGRAGARRAGAEAVL